MMVFSIHVCKETVILFRMAVYKINYMYTLIQYTRNHFILNYKSALRLASEISYAMTMSVTLFVTVHDCLKLHLNGSTVELPLYVELQQKGDANGYLKYDCMDIYGK